MKDQTQINSAILSTLCYYDVFSHPLTALEIFERISIKTSIDVLQVELNTLVELKIINQNADFYFLPNQSSQIVQNRKEKELRAEEYYNRSKKYSKIIGKFPFVKAVCISGSLSKGVMEKDGDVDYFIITDKGRLWICRSLLILFKKICLLNSRKYFCTNYFVDIDNLEIPDKNLFTATEINSLKLVYKSECFEEFINQNSWTIGYQPNFRRTSLTSKTLKKGPLKRVIENLLNGKFGEKLDTYFFKLTLNRWKNKFPNFDEKEFDLHMRSRKNVSKHHPRAYQTKVLDRHKELLEKFSAQLNTLTTEAA